MTDNNNETPKNFPKLYGGKLSAEFNTNDFRVNEGYVTFNDLLSYANLYTVNIFTSFNAFSAIAVTSLNDISDTTLAYLQNVTGDIQQQFNVINQTLTDISYDATNDLTMINNNVSTLSLTTDNNVTAGNRSILQDILCQDVQSSQLITNNINSQNINTKTININGIPFQDVGIYLICSVQIKSYGQYTSSLLQLPLYSSTLITTLAIQSQSNFEGNIIIKPNYRIDFLDSSNNLLSSFTNTTNQVIYFQSIQCSGTPYKLNLFYNGILY